MINAVNCAALSVALEQLKKIVKENEDKGQSTVIFCEDRLTLAAERTVCAAVGGTFLTSVYTLARFLSSEKGKAEDVLSSQGSAMAIRKIIGEKKNELTLFKKLSAAGAAQSVYDTIALLYSSRVSAEDAARAAADGILGGKLHDLAIIYSEYEKYLKENGKRDRNAYLRELGPVIAESQKIKNSAVIFLGFQALTCTTSECVRAAFSAAQSVTGLFIGGNAELYVNEAAATFIAVAKEFGGAEISTADDKRIAEAEVLRRAIYNAESFYSEPFPTDKVNIYEAADEEEELEFIAVNIKKHVQSLGERYAKISVMLPNLEEGERALSRVFARYKIPYYADRRLSLAEHPLCAFVINYLICAVTGCEFKEADEIVASPFFPAERTDKDAFRNYLIRFSNFRGGVKRVPRQEALDKLNLKFETVENVRKTFLKGLDFLTVKGGISSICEGLHSLLACFDVENRLKTFAEKYADEKPAAAQFSSRAYESLISVLSEAEAVSGENVSLKEFIKILKSGFAAMKISLIPPKSDAVFVGDLAATANTGSNVVFAAHLSGEVPDASSDTSLLTDREISALEGVNLNISPKIRQVNARKREVCALNICAFRQQLYLTYHLNGEDASASELIAYAAAAFRTVKGEKKEPVPVKKVETLYRALPYYCSEPLPAIKYLRKFASAEFAPSVYRVLINHGFEREASAALKIPVKRAISCGQRLYTGGKRSISPTTLESYFACPYLGFLRQGLKVQEREEGAVRPVDTGNFIHAVLQEISNDMNSAETPEAFSARARQVAEQKLGAAPYSSLVDSKSGKYLSEELLKEAVLIADGMYQQVRNSSFRFSKAECGCEVKLPGVNIYGRIDRVDECGDMVRIIDYKTGNIDVAPAKYYSGAKLQLPLYLLAVSEGKRAAGAYYFPASLEYRDKKDGVFRLQGFMDGSEEVVKASDSAVQPKKKSDYVNAYLGGGRSESAMQSGDFTCFLEYSKLIASVGAKEMLSGNIEPSPAEGTCLYCKAGGSCGVNLGKNAEERVAKPVKCSDIAALVRREKGVDDEND